MGTQSHHSTDGEYLTDMDRIVMVPIDYEDLGLRATWDNYTIFTHIEVNFPNPKVNPTILAKIYDRYVVYHYSSMKHYAPASKSMYNRRLRAWLKRAYGDSGKPTLWLRRQEQPTMTI